MLSVNKDGLFEKLLPPWGVWPPWRPVKRWSHGYRVARVSVPEGLGETSTQVWRDVLSAAAVELSQLPLIATVRNGVLPAVPSDDHERWVDFISRKASRPSHSVLWELAASCAEADPPIRDESEGWSEIAEGWEALGVSIGWLSLQEIGRRASSDAGAIVDLSVDDSPHDWLARYLDAVGESWKVAGTTKGHVAGLLPDQHGHLHSAGDLLRDGGVSDRVKQICGRVGLDLKAELLDCALVQSLTRQGLKNGDYAIEESTGDELSEDGAIDKLVRHLADALPDDQPIPDEKRPFAEATVSLLAHLWESKKDQGRKSAWQIPILAADGTARRAGSKRMMVPPVFAWPEPARRFAQAYPEGRVLANDYAAPEYGAVLDAFAAWGIAHPGLLVPMQREEIAERALRAIAANEEEVAGAKLRGAELSQIALLEPELINFCKQDLERARSLLGLVVCYVASADRSWRSTTAFSARTPEGDKKIEVTPSLWLADLRSKPWIPVEDQEDVTHHVPNPVLLSGLIDPEWLDTNQNGGDLLVRHFDMDALECALAGGRAGWGSTPAPSGRAGENHRSRG